MPEVTIAGESPCQLCPGDTHPFYYSRAGSYIIQCPKEAAERDQEVLVALVTLLPLGTLALTAAGRLYKVTVQSDQVIQMTPIVMKWTQRARVVE